MHSSINFYLYAPLGSTQLDQEIKQFLTWKFPLSSPKHNHPHPEPPLCHSLPLKSSMVCFWASCKWNLDSFYSTLCVWASSTLQMVGKSELELGIHTLGFLYWVEWKQAQECEWVGIVSVQGLSFLFTFNVDFAELWPWRVWDPLPNLPLLLARFKGSEEPCVQGVSHWVTGGHRLLSDICYTWFQGAQAI